MASVVSEMMRIVHPTDEQYQKLSFEKKYKYHMQCILAYKGVKTMSSGKVQKEYSKKLKFHLDTLYLLLMER